MQAQASLSIARVVDGWDMRMRHSLREKALKGLKHGQCLVALNGKHTLARVIDNVGGVHDYYADPGQRFNIDAVSQMMQMGVKVKLTGVVKHDRELRMVA